MAKGKTTRDSILRTGLDLVSELGVEGLTIGVLAKQVGMSKSGLYAHFGSKEDLQIAVLDTAAEMFVDQVVAPALKESRGLPRVEALYRLWIVWPDRSLTGGCPFIAAATELDDRPGPVRARLVGHLRDVTGVIERAARIAMEEGHFRSDLDPGQFAYEFWANLTAAHHHKRLFDNPAAHHRADTMHRSLIERALA